MRFGLYFKIEQYEKEKKEMLPDVLDALSCEYGCNGGPAIGRDVSLFEASNYMYQVALYTFLYFPHRVYNLITLFLQHINTIL